MHIHYRSIQYYLIVLLKCCKCSAYEGKVLLNIFGKVCNKVPTEILIKVTY